MGPFKITFLTLVPGETIMVKLSYHLQVISLNVRPQLSDICVCLFKQREMVGNIPS